MFKISSFVSFILMLTSVQPFQFNFNKVVCNVSDPSYINFEKCFLKAVARNHQYVSIKAVLLQKPINDIKVRFQVVKRANGWKPFLYDITVRCDFLKHQNTVKKVLWSAVKAVTNINHSCPFNEDIELYKLENTLISSQLLKDLPVPKGEYGFLVNFILDNKYKAVTNFYGTVF